VDAGIAAGVAVSTHYDPMLAKVIAFAPDRASAARRLAAALAGTALHGLVTNRDLLVNVLRHPDFRSGAADTDFLDRHAELTAPRATPAILALAAALAEAAARRTNAVVQPRVPTGWRNLPSQPQRVTYLAGGEPIDIDYRIDRTGLVTDTDADVALVSHAPHEVVLDVAGVRHRFAVTGYETPAGRRVEVDSALGSAGFLTVPRFADPTAATVEGATVAPMPGQVTRLTVAVGDRVARGAELLVLEAMKMRHRVVAATGGVIAELRVTEGQQVDAGAVLAVLEEDG
jgi:propionyl-CoA carboxylase alpha chain